MITKNKKLTAVWKDATSWSYCSFCVGAIGTSITWSVFFGKSCKTSHFNLRKTNGFIIRFACSTCSRSNAGIVSSSFLLAFCNKNDFVTNEQPPVQSDRLQNSSETNSWDHPSSLRKSSASRKSTTTSAPTSCFVGAYQSAKSYVLPVTKKTEVKTCTIWKHHQTHIDANQVLVALRVHILEHMRLVEYDIVHRRDTEHLSLFRRVADDRIGGQNDVEVSQHSLGQIEPKGTSLLRAAIIHEHAQLGTPACELWPPVVWKML